MLSNIHIENIALISSLDLDLTSGFTVLTGETGAGKSILIDSINMLTGVRVGKELVRAGADSCLVSAVFEGLPVRVSELLSENGLPGADDDCIMLSRSLTADGRSSCRINGKTVPLSVLRPISAALININGQNDTYALLDSSEHIKYVDRFAGGGEVFEKYAEAYKNVAAAHSKIEEQKGADRNRAELTEILKYRVNELSKARLKAGEQQLLEQKRDVLRHSEKILSSVRTAQRALSGNDKGGRGAIELSSIAGDRLSGIGDILPEAMRLSERLNALSIELGEISEEVSGLCPDTDEEPGAVLDRINSRLDLISTLEHKYSLSSVEELIDCLEKAKNELEKLSDYEANLDMLEREYASAVEKARECALALTETRRAAADKITAGVVRELSFLDMDKVGFEVRFFEPETETGLDKNGAERIEFYIKTNSGESFKPLAAIASGGELSRIMLGLQCVLSGSDGVGTLIFDEIDTGISGKTAQKIGVNLHKLSSSVQVVCVTHSAQVASAADSHFRISKSERGGRTETQLEKLGENERIEELSRILGGVNITQTVRENARELIAEARNIEKQN
ncbi:MAG: DNA repair protein RecN [Firmicutes bacterium]|nr:DNA repair protein RecN [Bacillota bacterium]